MKLLHTVIQAGPQNLVQVALSRPGANVVLLDDANWAFYQRGMAYQPQAGGFFQLNVVGLRPPYWANWNLVVDLGGQPGNITATYQINLWVGQSRRPQMSNPIGLTRAEEALEQPPPKRTVVQAPPGVVKCRVIVLPSGDACGDAATCRIVWHDGDVTPSCADCAQRMGMKAQSEKTSLRIVPGVR